MSFDLTAVTRLLVAALGGLAVGIEREWSGKTQGPKARFAGIRTFTMLGLVAGLSGWLWTEGLTGPALVFLAGLAALVVVAYMAASRRDVDGTTEVSAFVVLAAGVLAGAGYLSPASAIVAVTVLLLVEKKQLHRLVRRIGIVELRAGVRFAVMAAVILPLLPVGPYGPYGGIRPRQLWELVLFFSGLSFLGYLARRAIGPGQGYTVAGLLGGLVSSTSVTLTFSRLSRNHASVARPLAAGVMGANVMLFPRVLIASLVLAPAFASQLWPACIAPVAIGLALMWRGMRDPSGSAPIQEEDSNPLQVRSALQMAVIFQVVLIGVGLAQTHFGNTGLTGSGALLGLVDVDALTLSMAKMTTSGTATAQAAARALTVGILVNTIVKLGIALIVGRGRFRPLTAIGLSAITVALGVALLL